MWWVQTLRDARKGPGKLYLSAIFSSGYKNTGFLRWMLVQQDTGMVITQSKDLKTVTESGRHSWYLKTFSHTGIGGRDMTCTNWNRKKSKMSLRPLNTCNGFRHDKHSDFEVSQSWETFNYQYKEIFMVHKSNLAVQWNGDVQGGQKCMGLPPTHY